MTTLISTISPGLAPSFSPLETYAKDVFVLYNNKYWKCSQAITEPGLWDPTKWTEATDLLSGVKEVVLGGDSEPTEGKIWIDYNDQPTPTEVSLISDFNPSNPAQYLRDFFSGSYATEKLITAVKAALDVADDQSYPGTISESPVYDLSTDQDESSDSSSSSSETPVYISDFNPTTPAEYLKNFLSGSALKTVVYDLINETDVSSSSSSSTSTGSSGDSSSEERTVSLRGDFDPTNPEDYVMSFLHGSFFALTTASVVSTLYDASETEEYPETATSRNGSAPFIGNETQQLERLIERIVRKVISDMYVETASASGKDV